MQSELGQPRHLHRWALLLVCLAAFSLRFEGINWPLFHPDENPIAHWIDNSVRGGNMKEQLYAQGFFRLIKPAVWISQGLDTFAFQRDLKDHVRRTGDTTILIARWFNVWAGMLVCLAGYLLVRRITRSPWAGVFGAALLGLAQYPVEHSHYGETDIAMLLTLTTTLWLIAVTADTRCKLVFVLAALAGGFAAGTKFTLFLLLPVILALSVTFDARPLSLRAWVRAGGFVLAGLICFLLGFLLAMPEAADMNWFFKNLALEKARVFGETALNAGPLRCGPQIRYMLHTQEFLKYLNTLGWGWLVLVVVGLPCLALRAFRRFWTVTLLFTILFLFYWIYQAPWVRSQEFMAFLPGFAVLAALPLIVLWRSGPGFRLPVFRRMAILVLAAAALIANGINGCRTASLFGWTDTRLLAKQWLQTYMPTQRTIATERYADPAWVDTGKLPVSINKIEKDGLDFLLARDTDYLLRTANIHGRGLRNPLTYTLYSAPQALFDEFIRNSERLCVWASLPPQGLATFVSPAIELYGLKNNPREYKINLELPQPLWLNNYFNSEKGRQTFFPVGRKLGAATGLLIDCLPRTIAIGGPNTLQWSIYLIFNTDERAAAVNIRGFGQTRRAVLSPYDTAIVPLERSRWRPHPSQFEEITLRTERVKDVTYIPCFARVAFNPSEAVRICLDLDAEEAVWKTFSEQDVARRCDPATAYLLAVRSARWAWAEQLETAAGRVETALTTIARSDPATVHINGNSGYYYNEFARTRMDEAPRDIISLREERDARLIVKESTTIDCLNLTEPVRPASEQASLYEAVLQLPVRLARGGYTFCGEVMAKTNGSTNETPDAAFEFYFGQPEQRIARHAADHPDTWAPIAFEFQVARETQPRFIVRTHAPARLYFRDTEVRWSLLTALTAVREDLAVAHAAQAIAGGKYADALRRLANLDPEKSRWNELEIRQLALAGARGLGDQEASRQAARRLLELAPGDYASLQVLAETNPAFQAVAKDLAANLKTPVEFGAQMNLVGFILNPSGQKVRCVWEAKKNETPPMAVSFWIRRHGEWRKKQVRFLSDRQWLAKGERVTVEVKLNEAFAGYAPDTIALGLETAVQWHPGALPVVGSSEPVVPFADVLRH